MQSHRKRTPRSGFTLLEAVLVLTVLATTLSAVAVAVQSASSSFEEERTNLELSSHAHRLLDSIAREFVYAGRDTLDPLPAQPAGSSSLAFQQPIGFIGSDVDWGPQQRFQLTIEDGELDDGIDNNGDGLADEQVIEWIENPGLASERRVVRARGVCEYLEGEDPNGVDDNGNGLVDEPGLVFEVQGDVLLVRLSLQRIARGERLVTKTVQTSVKIRN